MAFGDGEVQAHQLQMILGQEELLQGCQTIRQSKTIANFKRVNMLPLIEEIDSQSVIVSLLHIPLGLCGYVLDAVRDFVLFELEWLPPAQHAIRLEY